jgi:hypothetical protein
VNSIPTLRGPRRTDADIQEFNARVYHGKSIAVVGNSHSAKGSGTGPEIDAHDIVVRCNSCFSPLYPDDLGVRTSIWATNFCKAMKQPVYDLGPDTLIVCYRDLRFPIKQKQMSHFLARPEVIKYYKAKAFYISPKTNVQISADARRKGVVRAPTLGLAVILHILSIIDKIDKLSIYGFSFYEEEDKPACHDPKSEKIAIQNIVAENKKVSYHPPLVVNG